MHISFLDDIAYQISTEGSKHLFICGVFFFLERHYMLQVQARIGNEIPFKMKQNRKCSGEIRILYIYYKGILQYSGSAQQSIITVRTGILI